MSFFKVIYTPEQKYIEQKEGFVERSKILAKYRSESNFIKLSK